MKLITVTDFNCPDDDGLPETGTYELDSFRAWVHEVYLEGYKRDVPFPSLDEAIEIVQGAGCKVEFQEIGAGN